MRPLLALAAILAVALAVLAGQSAAAQAVTGPTVLTNVSITTSRSGETHVLIGFNQILPQFSIVSNDIDRPVLGFADTSRGAGAIAPVGVHGLLKSIEFNQRGAVLTLVLVGAGPIHVVANPLAGQALDLAITPAPQTGKDAGATGSAGPLPAHIEPPVGEDAFEVVPLKYADVSEVVGLLSPGQTIKSNDNFLPQEPSFGSSSLGNGQQGNVVPAYNPAAQDSAPTVVGQMVDDTIGIDRRLNAIILRGSPEQVALMKKKIAQVDVPVQSVLLETVFVELSETAAKNLGLDFNNASGQIAVATFQSGAFLTGNVNAKGFTASYSLQAAIYAEVQRGQGRIISKPRISAQSGTSAKIITGDALPILTSIALSGVNAVSQQVQYVNVGVTLQIAPRVSADGFVTSHIFAEVSSVTGYSQGYPTISQREASTSATVRDGDYFVIGGLTQEDELTTRTRVPGLGDIPALGELFKLHQETGSKTDLYIVVTPHILTRADAAAARTDLDR